MHEALHSTHEARVAVVATFTAAAEEGLTVREAIEATRAYLAHRGLPDVPDPVAFATNGRHTMRTGNLDAPLAIRPNGETI